MVLPCILLRLTLITARLWRKPPCRCWRGTAKKSWLNVFCSRNTLFIHAQCAGSLKASCGWTVHTCASIRLLSKPESSFFEGSSMRLPPAIVPHMEEVLREILRFTGPADVTLSRYFRENPRLAGRERGVIAEAVYGLLRNKLPLVMRANMPQWLLDKLIARDGEAAAMELAHAMNQLAPLDLRVNAIKANREDVMVELAAAPILCEETPYSPLGLRVLKKPALQNLPLFKSGAIEVQDEGSQLLAYIVGAKRGEMVVDFCAGAGGKTLALGAAMRNTGRLYAFDVSEKRLAKLKPRLARSGLSNVHPVQIAHERDAKIKRLAGKIERVLVDAPCSGLGTLRRNPDVKWRDQPSAIGELQVKQAAILAGAARLLKGGGRLVYATCSFLDEENDVIAEQFLVDHPDFFLVPMNKVLAEQKIELEMGDYLKLLPHQHQTDGFFAAVFERKVMPKKVFADEKPADAEQAE